jgi:hypothetical protein
VMASAVAAPARHTLAPAIGALAEFRKYPCQIAVAGGCAEDATVNASNTRTGTEQVKRRQRRRELRIAKVFNGIRLSCKDEDSVKDPAGLLRQQGVMLRGHLEVQIAAVIGTSFRVQEPTGVCPTSSNGQASRKRSVI